MNGAYLGPAFAMLKSKLNLTLVEVKRKTLSKKLIDKVAGALKEKALAGCKAVWSLVR